VGVRKSAVGLAIVLFVVVAAVLVAPRFADLDRYRPIVAEKASAALGRPVTLAGPISLSLVPSPHLTVRDLRIANIPGSSAPDMVRVREVDAAVSFWPLLAFQIDVTSARVIQPTILLERSSDGRPNWSFQLNAAATGSPAGSTPAGTGEAPAPIVGPGPSSFKIARLAVEDGTISYRGAGGVVAIEHINLVLTGDAISGPLHAEGGFTTFGATLAAVVDLGRFDGDRVPVSLALKAPQLATAEFIGDATLSDATPHLEGKLGLKGDDLGAVMALAGSGPLPPMLARPLQVTADVTASGERVALDHLALELGDIHGSGALHLTPGVPLAADLKFSMNTLDLDRFLAERAAVAAAPPKLVGGRDAATAALPREAGAPTGRIALPKGVTATVDLGVDALQWHQGVIRQLRLEAGLADGSLSIKRLGALLPGGSDIVASGRLDTLGALPRFDGNLQASADNFRDLLRWTGAAVDGVPADRLRRATLSGKIAIDGDTLEAKSIDLSFDSSHLTGAVTAALRARPAFGVRIAIDQLNLDPYFGDQPAPAQVPPAASAPAASEAVARITPPQALADALMSFDANLDAGVDTLIWRNQPIRKVHLLATLENRDLTLREFSVGDLGAAAGKLTGYLQGIGSAQSKADAVFDMHGPELGRVLRLVAPDIASADNFGAFTLGGELQQQGERLTLETDLEAAGGKLHVTGGAPQPGAWDVVVNLDHPSFNRLMRLVSSSYRPQGGELGPVKLHGEMEWAPAPAAAVAVKNLAVDVGGMTATGDLRLRLAARPMLTANLTLGDVVIDKFLPVRQTAFLEDAAPSSLKPGVMLAQAGARPAALQHWSKAPLDLDFLRLFDADVAVGGNSLVWANLRLGDPQVRLALKDAVLNMPQLSGRLFGGTLAASGALSAAAQPSLDIKANLTGADFKQTLASSGISRLEGSFDTQADFTTAGASPFDLISGLNGTALLKGRDGVINGINVPAVNQHINQIKGLGDLATLFRAATSGSTPFSSLDGTFKVTNGVAVSSDLHLVAEGGEGNGTTIFDLPNWTMVSRTDLHLTGVQGSPPIGITLKGSMDQPNWDVDFNAITRSIGTRAIERLANPPPAPSQGSAAPSGGTMAPQPLQPQDILRNLLKR
jgi:uncharacterized protein involved in outer membrane biogenesis